MVYLLISSAAFLISLILFILITAAVTSILYRRSFMASLVELYLRIITVRVPDKILKDGFPEYRKKQLSKYKLPKTREKNVVIGEGVFENMEVITFTPKACKDGKAILYLYGGGYVRRPRAHHIKYLTRLSKSTGCRVIAPLYLTASEDTPLGTYGVMTRLYTKLRQTYEKLVLMGDSSGGGLALGLSESISANGERGADALILFSPLVDISLSSSELAAYEEKDPLIWISNARCSSHAFAGGLPHDDYRVSPLYGNLTRLPPISLFTGDRELLYPDVVRLHESLLRVGVSHRFTVGRGMNHVYQIYPIPEARRSLAEVTDIINKT